MEARDHALILYNSMEVERVRYAAKEKEHEDKLNKMDVKLNTNLSSELKLREEIEALRVWERRPIKGLS